VLRTHQGTLGSIAVPVIVEPLGGHFLYIYRLGHEGGYFGIRADHVIRLIDLVGEQSSRPRSIKVLYKTRSLPIR
jgi:hypothetical protein